MGLVSVRPVEVGLVAVGLEEVRLVLARLFGARLAGASTRSVSAVPAPPSFFHVAMRWPFLFHPVYPAVAGLVLIARAFRIGRLIFPVSGFFAVIFPMPTSNSKLHPIFG